MPPLHCFHRHHHLFLLLLLLLVPSISALGARGSVIKPQISPNLNELVLDVGEPLNLTCRAAQPVAWCTDHTFTDQHYEELYEEGSSKPYISTLTIDAVNVSHVGYFSCVFNTSENKENNNCDVKDPAITSLYLYVKDVNNLMMVIHDNMISLTFVGQSVVLPCKPTFPEVTMNITKNFEPFTAEYDPRSGFLINQVTVKNNEGNYLCVASYQNRAEDLILILDVTASKEKPNPPTVTVEGAWQEDTLEDPVVYYVREGTSVNLTCIYAAKKIPPNIKLRWSENTLNESGTHRILREPNKTSEYKNRYYEINNATQQDSGIYTCTARSYQLLSEPSHLVISVVAKDAAYLDTTIFHPNVTEVVMEGEPVLWEILFLAHPAPDFKWKKEGTILRDSKSTTSRLQFRNYEMNVTLYEASISLFLHHPALTDNGKYTLEASLPGTNITSITTMFLMIPGKPQKVELRGSNDNLMFKEGDNFSLSCKAEGYPKPRLSLRFIPHQSVPSLPRVKSGSPYNQMKEKGDTGDGDEDSMVVRKVHWMGVAEYPGHYQCVAENTMGEDFSPSRAFLVTDGELALAISLKVEIGGVEKEVVDRTVLVVEQDDLKVTCRGNKVSVKAPLRWTLNNNGILDEATMKAWGMEVKEEDTRLSLLSTLRVRSVNEAAGNFSILCSDQEDINTSLFIHVQEMVAPSWKGPFPGKDYDNNKNDNLTLHCPADGNPRPVTVWKKGERVLVENNRLKIIDDQLLFEILSPSDSGKYTCEVINRAGDLSASFNVSVQDPDDQKTALILAVVGVLIAALLVLSVFFCRKIFQARKETLNLQLREQKMFMEGDPSSLNPDIPLEQQAELLPYNTKYEVSRDSIIFDKLLGAGAFGRVYRATALNLLPGEGRTTVAVKMMKSRTDSAQRKALRSEVKIMIHIGRHMNIVNLLGACSKDLASKGELLLLVEYCKHGNILDYMRRRRREFINQINGEDKIDPSFCEPRPRHRSDSSCRSHSSRGLKYAHLNFHQDKVFYGAEQTSDGTSATPQSLLMSSRTDGEAGSRPFRARTVSVSSANQRMASDNTFLPSETSAGTTSDGYLSAPSASQEPLCSADLLEWSYQIAKGMEYLAFKKVLHGDLAARNVLLAENNVVKISDFGLAKDIYKNDNYRKRSSGPMPVKWLAVECLRDGVFSTQSDVWSFGVVLWEIFTLGQIPYSCSEFDESFILKLEKGVRLEQPRYSTYGLYRLMLECWNSEPMERPSFTALEASLEEMRSETQRQNYLQLTEPYQEENGSSEFLDMLPSQDYSAKVRQTTPQRTEDGYEMPFSPGLPPQLVAHDDQLSSASRLTSRQVEYLRAVDNEDAASTYVPMSADRVDGHNVFDFDNETVACIMSRSDSHENGGHDLYLKMDKVSPQSPEPDAPDIVQKRHEGSPRRSVLNSVSSQGSQHRKHPEVRKHDSGVYSPTVLAQTNPGYMVMGGLLSTDEHNYINTEASEANSRLYANCKTRDYLADDKCGPEYTNLIPRDFKYNRAESDSSSGVGSVEGGTPPQETEIDRLTVPPIPEEAMVV